jgi:hypothetical protein
VSPFLHCWKCQRCMADARKSTGSDFDAVPVTSAVPITVGDFDLCLTWSEYVTVTAWENRQTSSALVFSCNLSHSCRSSSRCRRSASSRSRSGRKDVSTVGFFPNLDRLAGRAAAGNKVSARGLDGPTSRCQRALFVFLFPLFFGVPGVGTFLV